MKFLALDPGGSTGVAEYDSTTKELAQYTLGPGPHHTALWDVLEQDWWDVVIYERFLYQRRELSKGVSLVLDSVEYIGVVKLYVARWRTRADLIARVPNARVPKLVEQPPHYMKLWDDRKLKAAGLWTTDSPHARDATRHLMYYLTAGPTETQDRSFIARTKP